MAGGRIFLLQSIFLQKFLCNANLISVFFAYAFANRVNVTFRSHTLLRKAYVVALLCIDLANVVFVD